LKITISHAVATSIGPAETLSAMIVWVTITIAAWWRERMPGYAASVIAYGGREWIARINWNAKMLTIKRFICLQPATLC
jgi:hypothetical protein